MASLNKSHEYFKIYFMVDAFLNITNKYCQTSFNDNKGKTTENEKIIKPFSPHEKYFN